MMDLGGLNLALIAIFGVGLLGLALLYMVLRTKSRGKRDNTPTIDRRTRQRYADEERNRKDHLEDDD